MVGDANPGIQVLNISNVNAQGKTVLNDGKLLELIQKYPFLYSNRVRASKDNDYTVWAWKNINAAFNRSYASEPDAAFSTDDLINRWHVLKPLIQCLSKAYDLEAIPQSLRKPVVKISTELEDQRYNVTVRPNSNLQNLLLKNMCSIAVLPIEQKLALEREILDFILTSELESKQAAKLDEAAWKEIHQNTEEFLDDIGFKQLLLTSFSGHEKINNHSNQCRIRETKLRKTLGWVPLKDVHKFTKPCLVKVRRQNFEDYLPLAKIIQLDKRYSFIKTRSLSRDSLGIFGV